MAETGFRPNEAEDVAFGHKPVLLEECLTALNIQPDGIYLDGTLGRAGHSLEIVRRLTTGRLIGVDRDETAIAAARERLADYMDRVTLVHRNFDQLGEILEELGLDGVDGMLFDLGVSSPQLDEAQRGFSYRAEAPLDMRMDASEGLTAYEVVNTWDEGRLNRILWDYGEERYARRITAAILAARAEKPIASTLELVDIIKSAMPAAALREKQHPAKRTALRDQLPLPGGSNREKRHRRPGERLYLPSGSADLYLRFRQNAAECQP